MASRKKATRWLEELTNLPTASGREELVVEWVTKWVKRRPDLRIAPDSGGNLLITQKGRKGPPPVIAVAHMDHPAFIVSRSEGRNLQFEFRGGVNAEYFEGARVRLVTGQPEITGLVTAYDPDTQTGSIRANRAGAREGDIAIWKFPALRPKADRFRAPACDDLAGCAAALAALDRARSQPERRHFGVLLTRAEEVGLVGAIHAAKTRSIPEGARLLSIETSRASEIARIGAGPIIRVGDALTVFDQQLTNRVAAGANRAGIVHQRKLMDGGTCEASAFLVYGYQATGLCLALGNWHNRGNLDKFEAGHGEPIPMMEEISLSDFHGLVDLLLVATDAADSASGLEARFDDLYENVKQVLD